MNAAPTGREPRDVRHDWEWARGHERAAVDFIRNHVCRIADSSHKQDTKEATDYVLTSPGNIAIAMRVRRISHVKTRRDFTLRLNRRSGAKTEAAKIAEGHADLYCYVWINDLLGMVEEYLIVDMHKFRAEDMLDKPDGTRWTHDKSAEFAWWDWRTLQDAKCIVEGCKYPTSPIKFWIVV